MGFWCQWSSGWWRQLCLGEQMNVSEPLPEPSAEGRPLPLTQRPPRYQALLISLRVRGPTTVCMHTLPHLHVAAAAAGGLVAAADGSSLTQFVPLVCCHDIPGGEAKHPFFPKSKCLARSQKPKRSFDKILSVWRYFQSPRPSGWEA